MCAVLSVLKDACLGFFTPHRILREFLDPVFFTHRDPSQVLARDLMEPRGRCYMGHSCLILQREWSSLAPLKPSAVHSGLPAYQWSVEVPPGCTFSCAIPFHILPLAVLAQLCRAGTVLMLAFVCLAASCACEERLVAWTSLGLQLQSGLA